MSKKPSAQVRAAAKVHRSDAAFWKKHSEGAGKDQRSFFRQAAANHLKEARRLERGK